MGNYSPQSTQSWNSQSYTESFIFEKDNRERIKNSVELCANLCELCVKKEITQSRKDAKRLIKTLWTSLQNSVTSVLKKKSRKVAKGFSK